MDSPSYVNNDVEKKRFSGKLNQYQSEMHRKYYGELTNIRGVSQHRPNSQPKIYLGIFGPKLKWVYKAASPAFAPGLQISRQMFIISMRVFPISLVAPVPYAAIPEGSKVLPRTG
jgi:hypothetical protein